MPRDDQLIWKDSPSGELSLKDAYNFHRIPNQRREWSKIIWNSAIPPSKSFHVWRIIHNKMPTDENLQLRGLSFPSMCSLCNKQPETSKHLFLNCPFSLSLWNWLCSLINLNLNLTSVLSIFKICKRGWSQQGMLVIAAAVINILNVIWWCRNNKRFNDVKPNFRTCVNMIVANTSTSGNLTSLTTNNSIHNFVLLKAFNVKCHLSRAPKIIEVLWQPPIQSWVKCNTDGASLGSTGLAACGGIFRDCKGDSLGCFAVILGIILAIESAYQKNWSNLWIETDSMIASLAFKSQHIVPWQLKNRWENCLLMMSNMHFMITHIVREGNHCADKLANLGLSVVNFTWWNYPPAEILEDLSRNRLGLPYFRFC